MRFRLSSFVFLLYLSLMGTSLFAQETVLYTHGGSGDLIHRSVSGGEERSGALSRQSDKLFPNGCFINQESVEKNAAEKLVGDSIFTRINKRRSGLKALRGASVTVDTTLSPGQIPMTSTVSPTGARTHSVPVPTASGCKFAPSISLEYNSQCGEGEAGFGWRIGGISSIVVRGKNVYYDGTIAPASYGNSYRYTLDGKALVSVENPGEGEYSLETVTGDIRVKPIINDMNFIVQFVALFPDGSRAQYSYKYASQPDAFYPITEMTDADGNVIKYKYLNTPHPPYYIEHIVYGPGLRDTIAFSYTTRDTCLLCPHYACRPVNHSHLLWCVSSSEDGVQLSNDTFSYTQQYGTWLLQNITRTHGTEQLNPLRFGYGRYSYDNGEEYYDNAPEKDSIIISGRSFATAYYTHNDSLLYRRGKFIKDQFEDGLIVLPDKPTYARLDTNAFGISHYGSAYGANDTILVYPDVSSDYLDPIILITSAGFKGVQAADVDGNGTEEIVTVNASLHGDSTLVIVRCYSLTSQSSFVTRTRSFFFPDKRQVLGVNSPVNVHFHIGDFTGCGKIQVLLVNAKSGDSRVIEYYNGIDSSGIVFSGEVFKPNTLWSPLFCQDIDSDGQTEICQATVDGFNIGRVHGVSFYTTSSPQGLNDDILSRMLTCGDLNGDGYLDILYHKGDTAGLYCCQYTGSSFIHRSVASNFRNSPNYHYQLIDINRDGLGDFVSVGGRDLVIRINEKGMIGRVVYFTHKDWSTDIVGSNFFTPGGMSCIMTVDMNDITTYKYLSDRSKLRLMAWSQDSFGNTTLDEYANLADDANLFTISESKYQPSEGYCVTRFPLNALTESYSYPLGDIDTLSSCNYYRYRYTNPTLHQLGLGFQGFQYVYSEDRSEDPSGSLSDRPPLVTEAYYDPENFSVPTRVVHKLRSAYGTVIDSTSNRYSKVYHPYRKEVPRLDTTITIDAIGKIRSFDRFVYDSFDYVTQHYSIKEALDTISSAPGAYVEKWTGIRYGHQISLSDSLWLLGNVLSVTEDVTDYAHSSNLQFWEIITENTYSRGSNRPDTIRQYVGMTDQIEGPVEAENLLSETRFTYDSHGNVTSKLSAAYGATDLRGTHYTYDAAGRFLLSETDAAGLTTTYSGYNLFGKPTSVTDPRGNVTSYTYDNWGNPLTTASPGGRRDTVIRRWAVIDSIGSLYSVTTRSNASPERTTWYNSLGQEVRSAVKRFDGSTVITDKQYSNGGRLLRESLPRRDTAQTVLWNTTGYDTLGRVAAVTAASGAQTLYHYDGRRTTTTREGISSRKTVGADGNVVKSEDIGGEIQYYYRPDGQPDSVRVTAAGTEANLVWATTRFTYDAYGRRTSIIDPSAGTRSDAYTDNADGSSVTVHTTANGTVTTYCDTLGRVTRIQRHDLCTPPRPEEPEERSRLSAADSSGLRSTDFTTDYKYNAYGDLLSARSNNGTSTHYAYDTLGRVVTQRDSVPGNHWLQKGFSYDTTGRIASTAYTTKSGISVTESYTYTNGYHTKTTARDTTIWGLLSENALGQPTLAQTGTAGRGYSYDAYGYPTERSLWTDQNELTMDFRYGYDHATGNMSYREDRTRTVSGGSYAREEFTYDDLNRLTSMSDNLLAGANARNVTYSRSGNITSMGGSGTFAYADSLHHPYQVTGGSIGGDAWCPVPALTAGYTGYDRPMYIDGESGQVEFTYNDAGERVRAAYVNYSTGETPTIWDRIYIGGQYERGTEGSKTRETLWLGGDAYSAPMIFYRENNTGGALYNIGRDVQGSITHLAMVSGDLLKEYSYDPWGRQRNPDTHAFPTYGPLPGGGDEEEEEERALTTILIPVLHRGYCGHEYIEPFGLINMNARLYDPFTGRFFSPDPYVQAPDFSQNFNRYAYCLNNPLKYEDESGEFIFTSLLGPIGAFIDAACWGSLISGASYIASVAMSKGGFGNWNWNQFGKSLAIGAISGVATYGIGQIYGAVGSMGLLGEINRATTHAMVSGGISFYSDSNFGQGFLSGGMSSIGSSAFMMYGGHFANSPWGNYLYSAITGGIGAKISGGEFWKGAVVGTINAGLNHLSQTIEKPSFDDLWANYPKTGYNDIDPEQVYQLIGGKVLEAHLDDPIAFHNACALRVSRALNYSGVSLPSVPGKTMKGADGKNYFYRAADLYNWLRRSFGAPDYSTSVYSSLKGKKGIYIMQAKEPAVFNAWGHASLYNMYRTVGQSYQGTHVYRYYLWAF